MADRLGAVDLEGWPENSHSESAWLALARYRVANDDHTLRDLSEGLEAIVQLAVDAADQYAMGLITDEEAEVNASPLVVAIRALAQRPDMEKKAAAARQSIDAALEEDPHRRLQLQRVVAAFESSAFGD